MCEQEVRQSVGGDPKGKRNSGLFSFLRWFRTNSRESVDNLSSTGSTDSLNSTGTAASFSFVAPTVYKSDENKCIVQGPETDTYKARLKQRDKVRERDKDVTLRKKYNLFFQRDSLKSKREKEKEKEDNSKSLPLMTRKMEEGGHRRTNSESSKTKRAGAYVHVKGKRKAPQPPKENTLSLRRKKRLAPQPPIITDKAVNTLLEQNKDGNKNVQNGGIPININVNGLVDNAQKSKHVQNGSISTNKTGLERNGSAKSLLGQLFKNDVICNDSLKLDHGILKQVKTATETNDNAKSAVLEAPVSPRPWYKRNTPAKKENKYEPVEIKPEKKEDKRKSGMMFLTNISELDREAAELMKKDAVLAEMPEFMRPKEEAETDTLGPKRRSAKDLIAKFNAITNVTKVTVNSALFAYRENSIFQKSNAKQQAKKTEATFAPLMKSETSACIVKQKKTWTCKRCSAENETWRLVCGSCKTTIKPYFDDDSSLPRKNREDNAQANEGGNPLERSKTQIGFSPLANYNNKESAKKEEREKLKKMLIEMKNSLPKRKSHALSNQQRKSTIDENPEFKQLDGQKDEEWLDKASVSFTSKNYFGENHPSSKATHSKNEFFRPLDETNYDSNQRLEETNVYNLTSGSNQEGNSDKASYNYKAGQRLDEAKTGFNLKTANNQALDGGNKDKASVNLKPFNNQALDEANKDKASFNFKSANNQGKNDKASSNLKTGNNQAFGGGNKDKASFNFKAGNLQRLEETNKGKSGFNLFKPTSNQRLDDANNEKASINVKSSLNDAKAKSSSNQRLDDADVKPSGSEEERNVKIGVKPSYNFKSDVIKTYNGTYFNKAGVKTDDFTRVNSDLNLAAKTQTNKPASSSDPNLNKDDAKLRQFDESMSKKEEDIKLIKPAKVSSSAQTSAVVKKLPEKNFQLMRPKDFEDIYSEKSGRPNANHLYANLAQSENLFLNVPKRFGDFGNNYNNTDTLEINRLLRRLENAIAKGDLSDAAIYARELAQLKVNCSVVRQKPPGVARDDKNGFMVEMYVEDRLSHRGPFPIQVTETQTVAELKVQVEKEFEIPRDVQRWILGKELASNDTTTLKDHNVCKEGCPIFLYLVAPSSNNAKEAIQQTKEDHKEINIPITYTPVKETKTKAEEAKVINKTTEEAKVSEPSTSNVLNVAKETPSSAPRIVEEKFKPIERLTDTKSKQILKIQEVPKIVSKTKAVLDEIKSPVEEEVGSFCAELELKNPPMATEEDFSEYDKTLKAPAKTWECAFCTLLNPLTAGVCLVCTAVKPKGATAKRQKKRAPTAPEAQTKHYQELMRLDDSDLVSSADAFECVVCFTEVPATEGVTLRECLHQFCRECLAHTVEFCEEAEVKCPYRDEQYSCDIALQDREVKALVTPLVYEQFLAKSVAQAENKIDKSFHCKTPDCKGWCIFEDNVNEFRCPVCRKINCLTCQAIHIGLNCKQYQERMNDESETDEDAKRTREMLEEMVNRGEALTCPACHVILMKKWGCDWVRCSMCKTEICWVTKGLRWGPAGKGDTSGGCKCGVNGVKCHPKCNYCH